MYFDSPSVVVFEAKAVRVLILGYPLVEFPGDERQPLAIGNL